MTQGPLPPHRRPWKQVLGVLVVVLLLFASAMLYVLQDGDQRTPRNSGPDSETPATTEPLEVSESTMLTVPDTQRLETYSFEAEAGSTYLLQFESTTTKPQGSPGDAMYFGASLACGGPTESTLRSVGATQNVRTAEEVSIRSQFLLEIEEPGRYACRLLVFSPNAEVAAAGTTADVATRWTATLVDPDAVEGLADERLPRLVEAGEAADAFVQELDSSLTGRSEIRVLGTMHLTTCTEVEGSSEDGRTWCPKGLVNPAGSAATITYRFEGLDGDGKVCESRKVDVADAEVDRYSHHQTFHVDKRIAVPEDLCGPSARLVITVGNGGPAPLLVHRASSTLVIIPG